MARNRGEPELRIVLVGKTGNGKSAVGNTILGNECFVSKAKTSSVTEECEKGETIINGRKIVVVDTPGFFDTRRSLEKTSKEVKKCMKLTYPGPHAIIQVMQLSRFTSEEKEVAKLIQTTFSLKARGYLIVLFTRKEDLEGSPLEGFLKEGDPDLWGQIGQCGGRCLAFNNKAQGREREEQVGELLRMIDALVDRNRGAPHYTEETLAEDKSRLQKMLSWCRIL